MNENPQLENGYVKIANDLVDSFCKLKLSPNETQILWCILRKTYGFNKKEDKISLTQFEKQTNLSRPGVVRALKKLVAKQILVVNPQPFIHVFSLNKKISQWINSSYLDTSTYFATRVVPIQVPANGTYLATHKRQENKDNIQKTREVFILSDLDFQKISEDYHVPISFVLSVWDDLQNWCLAKGKRYKNYNAALRKWVKKDAIEIKSRKGGIADARGVI